MARILVRQSVRQGMNPNQMMALKYSGASVILGDPAIIKDGNGVEWAVYDDPRITLDDVAVGACIVKNAGTFPDFDPTTVPSISAECRRFAQAKGVKYVSGPTKGPTTDNPWQVAIDAQGIGLPMRAE